MSSLSWIIRISSGVHLAGLWGRRGLTDTARPPLHFNPLLSNKELRIILPFTWVHHSQPVEKSFLTNEVRDVLSRLSQTSLIAITFVLGHDKCAIFIGVKLNTRAVFIKVPKFYNWFFLPKPLSAKRGYSRQNLSSVKSFWFHASSNELLQPLQKKIM